jgi:hypothetical protein
MRNTQSTYSVDRLMQFLQVQERGISPDYGEAPKMILVKTQQKAHIGIIRVPGIEERENGVQKL